MKSIKRQAGVTLIEALIGISLSLVVTSAMVALMANSLGSASRIIQMTQLSDELRNTMSMLTRDLRRANYSANAAFCYGNSDCGVNGPALQAGDITVDGNDCLIFNLDRDWDGDASENGAGGFRLAATGDGVGYIEMWVGDAGPDCGDPVGADDDDWIELSNPEFVDITLFNIDDADDDLGSFTQSLTGEGGNQLNQRTRHIVVQITGELILDENISRNMQDRIRVRNDFLWDPDL